MKRIYFLVAIFIISVSIVGIDGVRKRRRKSESTDTKTSKDHTAFDIEFLQKVNQLSPGNNIVVSPESVKSVLAMILEGSRGNTQKELKKVLKLPEDKASLEKLLDECQQALKKKRPNITLEFESKILLQNNEKLNPKYSEIIQKRYTSNVDLVNFSNREKIAADLNQWIKTTTNGLIPELITPADVGPTTRLLLANCIYFKGNWFEPFNVNRTRKETFYNDDDSSQLAYMMHIKDNFNYAHDHTLDADIVEIPFKDKNYVMIIVLPKRKKLNSLLEKLVDYTIPKLMSKLKLEEVELALPRFTIDYSSSLIKTLKLLGINELFSVRANLTGILLDNSQLAVDNILHKAKIEVNEEGAKAAAVTGGFLVMACMRYPVIMRADHPFVFFIHEKHTRRNLFEGILKTTELVENPAALNAPGPTDPFRMLPLSERYKTYNAIPMPIPNDWAKSRVEDADLELD